MTTIIFVLLLIWSVRILINIFSFAYLWYIKEYRFDRMLVHLKTEGLRVLFFPPLRRPPIRPKVFALVAGTIVLLFLLFTILPFSPILSIFIVDALTFMATASVVSLLKLPTAIYHACIVFLAARKLHSHAPMKVIGITGSVGKSSTKEYLATILSTRYNVLKTPGSKNALIGVAETINNDLKQNHEVFIVEMAAYKKGEIADITRLVRPTVGIVTTINEQHLDLFGSLENTVNAKYELISSLGRSGIVIVNADNTYTRQMGERAFEEGKEVWMFTTQNATATFVKKMFRANNIDSRLEGISFTVTMDKLKARVDVPVLGEHQAATILASIAGAVACGMKFEDAVAGAGFIQPFRKTMQPISGVNGSLFLDDTFNNNPQAAMAAIRFLSRAKGKKILVFQPMIELGAYTEKAHEEVGKLAGKVCDEIVLTNDLYIKFFKRGAHVGGFRKNVHVFSVKEASDFISSQVKKNDIVLFKGKEAGRVLKLLNTL